MLSLQTIAKLAVKAEGDDPIKWRILNKSTEKDLENI